MFKLTVHTFANGESAERSVWMLQLPLNNLSWDPALAELWYVVDRTLSAEWSVMVPKGTRIMQVDSGSDLILKVSTDLPTACRQVGIVGWRPIISADCKPVAIMELTSEDTALLISSENIHLKLKRERSRVHEISQLKRTVW